MKIKVGSTVKWVCRAGTLVGRVSTIQLDKNAADETIPWILVKGIVDQNGKQLSNTLLPGTDGYFAMMKLEVLK